ncbi:hypothetical protein CYR55_18430 [Chimaeribacter californicus]|uniref:DUF943 domain-containing protein n=1 Tax=Chimaeribacter californicus TaxID=2060067 RepID=A0A2N5DYA5_9GAMM|nr:DUF943 family protein [Chimaeribacter californicus]PLR32564.1 hypothetical protein CYR55_18430 [Chimaeribacter californicus]
MLKSKILLALLLVGLSFSLWWLSRPVKIGAIHRDGYKGYATILVKNFPLTDNGAISWWNENKNRFKEKYDIPSYDEEGHYDLVFLKWDGVYRTLPDTDQGSDLRCFDDMATTKNCIKKDGIVFSISKFDGGKIMYRTRNSNTYIQLKEQSEIKRVN